MDCHVGPEEGGIDQIFVVLTEFDLGVGDFGVLFGFFHGLEARFVLFPFLEVLFVAAEVLFLVLVLV